MGVVLVGEDQEFYEPREQSSSFKLSSIINYRKIKLVDKNNMMIEKYMKVYCNLLVSHAALICLPVNCGISCKKLEKHFCVQKNINKDVHTA